MVIVMLFSLFVLFFFTNINQVCLWVSAAVKAIKENVVSAKQKRTSFDGEMLALAF